MSYIAPTQKYVVFERARGYNSGNYTVYREKRLVKANTKFILFNDAQLFYLGDESNDLLPSAVKTILQTGFDDTNLKDYNDYTYSRPYGQISNGATQDLVKYDFGSINYRFIYLKIESGATGGIYTRVLISNDDATYTKLAEANNSIIASPYYVQFRYIKLQVYNATSYTADGVYWRYFTLEVYNPSSTNTITYTSNVFKLINAFIYNGSYQLLEVITV
jgi:hypothetical protein